MWLYLSPVLLSFIHFTAEITNSLLFVADWYSLAWMCHTVYPVLQLQGGCWNVCSSGWLQIKALNILHTGVCVGMFSSLSSPYPGVGLPVVMYVSVCEKHKPFSLTAVPFCIPTSNEYKHLFLHILFSVWRFQHSGFESL